MRSKCGGGKPRLFELLPQPSTLALNSLSPQLQAAITCFGNSGPTTNFQPSHKVIGISEANSDAHHRTMCKASEDGDQNTSRQNLTPSVADDMTVEEETCGDVADGMYGLKLSTACPDSLCNNVPETCEDGNQNITCQEQTLNAIDNMAVQHESYGKSLEGIHGPSLFIVDTGDGGQNTTSQKQTTNTNDDKVVEETACGKVPGDINGKIASSEIDWSEKEVCTKCNEGGKLLICSNKNCPLAVHEKCMRCVAHFDSKGKFYCPYCSYKQVMLATRKAKNKAMLAKKALSVFLDGEMLDGGPLAANSNRVRTGCEDIGRSIDGREEETGKKRRKLVVEPEKSMDGSLDDAETGEKEDEEEVENSKIVDDLQNERVTRHDQEEPVIGNNPEIGVEPEKAMERELDSSENDEEAKEMEDGEREAAGPLRGEDCMEGNDEVASDSIDEDSEFVLRSSRHTGNQNVNSTCGERLRQTSRKLYFEGDGEEVHEKKKSTKNKSKPSITNTRFSNAKRKRQLWIDEEEEMLKEGVARYSAMVNKNIPWMKILEFGRHIFHEARTANDLREKWKKLHKRK